VSWFPACRTHLADFFHVSIDRDTLGLVRDCLAAVLSVLDVELADAAARPLSAAAPHARPPTGTPIPWSADGPLWGPDKVCALLSVGKDWLYDQVEKGAFPVIRAGRQLRFRPQDVAAYIERNSSSFAGDQMREPPRVRLDPAAVPPPSAEARRGGSLPGVRWMISPSSGMIHHPHCGVKGSANRLRWEQGDGWSEDQMQNYLITHPSTPRCIRCLPDRARALGG
jgi:excisionase family DNA binding protein